MSNAKAAPPNRLRRIIRAAQPRPVAPKIQPTLPVKAAPAPGKKRVTVSADQLIVRPATVLDAVNIFKSLRAEEQRRELLGDKTPEYDEPAKIAHILTTIATGYVVVVELSGRIIGSLGFVSGAQGYEIKNKLVSSWSFLVPALRREDVINRVIATVVAFANKVESRVELIVDDEVAEFWGNHGFESSARLMIYNGDDESEIEEPDFESGEEASTDDSDLEQPDSLDTDGDFDDEDAADDATDPLYGPRGTTVDDDLDSELDDDGEDFVPPRSTVEPRVSRPRSSKV